MNPVPLAKFLKTLVGTPDQIWTKVLVMYHGKEKHTLDGWQIVLATLRKMPAA